jgi:lipopolysaccharide/colanic/teichoic acid biosynthesis glycosyltransferase
MKRAFDLLACLPALVLLSPLLILIAVLIRLESKGPVLYLQERIGKDLKPFKICKFRTMVTDADRKGLLTVGGRDPRITRIGYHLRKYKLDELPQLFNVITGEMSLVGPRPEVRKYVELYTAEQRRVLSVKPGITDYASIAYVNENEILGESTDPERTYIDQIMPQKLELNLKYIAEKSLMTDAKIIFKTLLSIVTAR